MIEEREWPEIIWRTIKKSREGGTTQSIIIPGDVRFKDISLWAMACERMEASLFGKVYGVVTQIYK